MKALKSFCNVRVTNVKIDGEFSDWFPTSAGVQQGYVTSPWLFNVYTGWSDEKSYYKSTVLEREVKWC